MNYSKDGQTSAANTMVFSGTLDGNVNAYDAKSGKVIWHHGTGASIIAPPATFAMNGNRYLLVASGDPGFLKVPELSKNIGPAVLTAFVSGSQQTTAATK